MSTPKCLRFLFLACCLMLISVPELVAQDHLMWTNLGIYGGYVQDLAVDPQNPSRIFAATYLGRGLYLSVDGGASWQALEMAETVPGEDTFNEQAVYAVAVAPSNPQVVWVAHNRWVAKSIDGGLTWTHITNSSMQADCATCGGAADAWRLCLSIAIHPTNPDMVWVGTGGPASSDAGGAVYATTDGGLSWSKLNQGHDLDYRVEDLAVSALHPDTLWAVTNSNGYGGAFDGTAYRSEDGGLTFAPILPKPLTGGILAVAPKPDDENMVFVAGGYGVIQLTYDGAQWNAAYPVTGCYLAADVIFAPSDPNRIYAAWMRPNDAYWLGDGLPKISTGVFDGSTWVWETFIPDPQSATALQALAVHPTDAGTLLGGDLSLGLLSSMDHGQQWTPINQGLDAVIVYDVDTDDLDTRHMIAASGSGFFERAAGASVWQRRLNGVYRAARFHPASAASYFAGGAGFVARTSDSGASWAYSNSLGYLYVESSAVDRDDPSRIYITTGHYGRQVLRSLDGGDTFQAVLNGINQAGQAYSMNDVVIDPQAHLHLLAAGGNFYSPLVVGDLWQSMDGGDTWQRTGLTDKVVNTILVDPRDSNVIYAGCGYSQNYDEPLYKSVDGGASWQSAAAGMPPARRGLYGLWGPGPDQLVAVGQYGYITRFDGRRWQPQETGTYNTLYGVYGTAGDDIFAVGDYGTILHYDGAGWQPMTSTTTSHLYKVWAAAAGDAYAVGQGGTILHYDGTAWSAMSSPTTADLYEIRATAADDIFAAGVSGTILHFDGSAWHLMASGTSSPLDGLWAASPSDVYAVGDGGVILHYDGTLWSAMPSPTTGDLWGIWGSGATDLYAMGPQGDLLHCDGTQWSLIRQDAEHYYQDVWGTAPGQVYITDANSLIWSYDGQDLTVVRELGTYYRSVTDLAFHRSNADILYAATLRSGVYISPDQAADWLNLGTPVNSVYAIASGSLYAATAGGMYQLTGTGVLTGQVSDAQTLLAIDDAQVMTDLGHACQSVYGTYMMVVPAGIFDLYALADHYDMAAAQDVVVTGSDVTRQDFALLSGSSVAPEETGAGTGGASGGGYCFITALDWF